MSKLSANLIVFGVNLLTVGIVPRGLGLKAYGDFSFLSDYFTKVIGFFDAGTSIGFFTMLSRRPGESSLIRYYGGFVLSVILILAVVISAVIFSNQGKLLWPAQEMKYIWMSVFWAILIWTSGIISKVVDAYALTVKGEMIRVSQKAIGAVFLLLMLWHHWFNLTNFFVYHYLITAYFCAVSAWLLARKGISLFPRTRLTRTNVRTYTREFYNYSAPLFFYGLVGLLVGIFDRWMLQKFSGSAQQGLYGLSYRVSTICFLFTGAMTPLFTREFAVAFGQKKKQEMRRLFSRFVSTLYAVAAYFGVFIAFQADKVSLILGGQEFSDARLAISIMAFYPLHQTYGQLTGAVFYSTGQTRLYRNIGVTFMLLGLPLAFFMIAPQRFYGLDLGSIGLAWKMVLVQFFWVNVLLWFNCKYLSLNYFEFLRRQVYPIIVLALDAYLAIGLTDRYVGDFRVGFMVSGMLYSVGVIAIVWFAPQLFSIKKEQLENWLSLLKTQGMKFITGFRSNGKER